MWEFNWGMTIAQIELLSVDKPLTLYGEKKKVNYREMQESIDDWSARHSEDGGAVNLSTELQGFL